MIVKYSNYRYDKVCIVFDKKIRVAGDEIKEICNYITESAAPIPGYEAAGGEATSQEQVNQEVDFISSASCISLI